MIVIPAIDIEGGRLAHAGAEARDPVREAVALRDAGASWLHVVDIDRAFARGQNDDVIRRVAALDGCHVQLGGGADDPTYVRDALTWGVARVIVGLDLLLGDADLPAGVGVNLDLRAGRVWPRAQAAPLALAPRDVVDRAAAREIRTVVCRDVDRDGTLAGADLDTAAGLVGHGVDILVAGGVTALDELARARAAGVTGVIVGRALHAGRFRLEEALAWSG